MKPISIRQVRTHIGVTLLGVTTTNVDRLRTDCSIYMMPWGFDVFHKGKKYGISFSNAYQWEYMHESEVMNYEQHDKRCLELLGMDTKAQHKGDKAAVQT